MQKFILGQKLGMRQIFDEKGNPIPVTLIEAGPCEVTEIKTKEKNGYKAVQIGFKKIEKEKKIKKTQKTKPFKFLREFKSDDGAFKLGDKILVSTFKEGDKISVAGISKGKGFSGVVKRWGFHGRAKTHGTKHEERTPGSVGSTTPSRVVKGRKMAGRAGGGKITVKNLKVVKVDPQNDLLVVKGAVPGRGGTILEITC